MQGLYEQASQKFVEAMDFYEKSGEQRVGRVGVTSGFWGAVLLRQGKLDKSGEHLTHSLRIKREIQDNLGILEVLVWLGELCELRHAWAEAESYYHQILNLRWIGRRHFECSALTSRVRVKHTQNDYTAILPLLTGAEQLAQQYEYNDHLASLRLVQGHISWGGHLPDWGTGFNAALAYYQQALIYALRYNRFLLDEVLWGGGVATPLRPIILHCLERGEEGRQMLVALHDWWQTGTNDVGTPRPDTISPIPEDISLLEAECLAREREPGDRSPQVGVVEKIEAALRA